MDNARARQLHESFKHLADTYNENEIEPMMFDYYLGNEHMLAIFQSTAYECWKLFKFLRAQENNDATQAYCVGCGKILIRLSFLRNHGRRETASEFAEHIGLYADLGGTNERRNETA